MGFFSRKGGWFHFLALANMGPLWFPIPQSTFANLLFKLGSGDTLPEQGCLQVIWGWYGSLGKQAEGQTVCVFSHYWLCWLESNTTRMITKNMVWNILQSLSLQNVFWWSRLNFALLRYFTAVCSFVVALGGKSKSYEWYPGCFFLPFSLYVWIEMCI